LRGIPPNRNPPLNSSIEIKNDEINKSRSESIVHDSLAVDSAWSQAQAFGDSASSQSNRINVLLQESVDSRSAFKIDTDDLEPHTP